MFENTLSFYKQTVYKQLTNPRNVTCEETVRAESSSVSNNIKFQISQNCFQNVQLFPINPIKCFNFYVDS